MNAQTDRTSRKHEISEDKSHRSPFRRDLDRLIHSNYLRRLASVTQVIGPNEGRFFHNRLTHSLKVAQISRGIANHLLWSQSELAQRLQLDADVVEAAALAHDMGHPPFGHAGETVLNQCVSEYDPDNGYEGNAQTFRIITTLASHQYNSSRSEFVPGLNLISGDKHLTNPQNTYLHQQLRISTPRTFLDTLHPTDE